MMKTLKIYLPITLTLLLFNGCTSNSRIIQLQNKTIQQSMVIQKQQKQIAQLQTRLQKTREIKRRKRYQGSTYYPKPKKDITLKKVEDHNYNSDYMYPDDKKKKSVTTVASTVPAVSMNKAECIAMIGEAKFNRYTEMFGNEAAAIKRCTMIQAMKK